MKITVLIIYRALNNVLISLILYKKLYKKIIEKKFKAL